MSATDNHGAKIHFELHGTAGAPILLIEGVGAIGNAWKPQVDELKATHQLATFDNRGIGQSTFARNAPFSIGQMADDARAVMVTV